MTEPYNLIVVKWGDLYSAEHVINLYEGAKRYTTVPFNFYVFTDDASALPQNKGWHFISLPDYNTAKDRGWWYKMEIFNLKNEPQGRNLYIDLDVIIINDLKVFWETIISPNLYICRDFNRQFLISYQACNSSIMGWRSGSFKLLFNEFIGKLENNMRIYRGDQDYLQAHAIIKTFWPDDLAMSWKWECWRGGKLNPTGYKSDILETKIDTNTRILVFHGQPKPEHCEDPKMIALWRGIKHK